MKIVHERKQKDRSPAKIVYAIYGADCCLFVGKTTARRLVDKLYHHFHKNRKYVQIDVTKVERIEYSRYKTEADMALYELYWIYKLHPVMNRHGKKDELTLELPYVRWYQYVPRLLNKWKEEAGEK